MLVSSVIQSLVVCAIHPLLLDPHSILTGTPADHPLLSCTAEYPSTIYESSFKLNRISRSNSLKKPIKKPKENNAWKLNAKPICDNTRQRHANAEQKRQSNERRQGSLQLQRNTHESTDHVQVQVRTPGHPVRLPMENPASFPIY